MRKNRDRDVEIIPDGICCGCRANGVKLYRVAPDVYRCGTCSGRSIPASPMALLGSGVRDETVPCGLCGTPTRMLNTRRCDACWELERRVHGAPELAARILASGRTPAEHYADQLKLALFDELAASLQLMLDTYAPRADISAARAGEDCLHVTVRRARAVLAEIPKPAPDAPYAPGKATNIIIEEPYAPTG